MWLLAKLRANQGLDLNISMLKFTGLWPSPMKTLLDRMNDASHVFVIIVCTLVGVIFLPMGAFTASDNLGTVFECVGIGFMHLAAAVRVTCFYLRADGIQKFAAQIRTLSRRTVFSAASEERQTIVSGVQKWTNIFAGLTLYLYITFVLSTPFGIPAMWASRKFFARLWFPINPYDSPTYEIILVLWGSAFLIASLKFTTIDGFIGVVLIEIVGQLNLLRHDLARIREDAVESVRQHHLQQEKGLDSWDKAKERSGSKIRIDVLEMQQLKFDVTNVVVPESEIKKEMNRLLGEYVYRYQEILRIVQDFESVFQPILGAMIFVTLVSLLAFVLFAGTNHTLIESTMDAAEQERLHVFYRNMHLAYAGVEVCINAEFAILCFLASKITEGSELVRDSVYNCDWFDATEGFKRSMRIIISCCNQPLVVKVAAFIPLSMETFLKTMNLAYSYYTTMTNAVFRRLNTT